MPNTSKNMKIGLALVLAAIIIAAGTLIAIQLLPPRFPTTFQGEADIQVINGDTVLNLSFSDLVDMTESVLSGTSTAQNRFENWRDNGDYIGVPLATLIELVGGMDADDVIKVNASDGYTQYYAYSNVYPNASYAPLQGNLVLALSYNYTTPGSHMGAWADGPRTVFLPPDNAYSNDDANQTTHPAWFFGSAGARWVRNVATIEVLQDAYIDSRLHVTVIDEDERDVYLMDLAQMNNLEAITGYQNFSGNWPDNGTYTGVLLSSLVELVADIDSNDIVNVVASDGWNRSFTYDNLYPNVAMHLLQGDLILAYIFNGTMTPSWTDGPRIAFLTPDGGFSNDDASQTLHPTWFTGSAGAFWVRNVATIHVIRDGLPP
jgi:hypothetical protein